MKRDIRDLDRAGLERLLKGLGEPSWRVDELRHWIYARAALSFAEMSSLPARLRAALSEDYEISAAAVTGSERSEDGTVKFLLSLADGSALETVLIPERGSLTQCLSTQAGCSLGCLFCRTGTRGPGRNLTGPEIADQWLSARRSLEGEERISNLVYMGMGEPLLNPEGLRDSVEIFTSPWGGGLSPARITVSTAGIVPGIDRMARELPGVNLAVSLNAPDDALRNRLMPVNRRYPLRDLLAALRRFPVGRRKLTIEYVLLGGTNDSPAMARRLAKFLRGLRCKINLIPFNPHSGLPFSPPSEDSLALFRETLRRAGYTAPVRRSKGRDIAAACGQLGGGRR